MVVLKVYNSYFSSTVVYQETLQSLINIEENLVGGGFCKFQASTFDELQPGVKVELVQTSVGDDVLLFRGTVYEIKPIWSNGFDQAEITCHTEDRVLERRNVLTFGNTTNQTPKTIIEELLDEYITNYNEPWTVVSSITDLVSIQPSNGQNLFEIISELAEQVSAKRVVRDWVIYFDENVGIDRTTGANYQEIVFDALSPSGSNLWQVELSITNTGASVVIANDGTSSVTVTAPGPFLGVKYKRFTPWDLTAKAQAFLESVNVPQRVYKVTVEPNTLKADIGDKIKLRVENTNSLFDVNLDVFIIKKTTEISNGDFLVNYEVSDILLQQRTEWSVVRDLQKRLSLLEVQT